MPTYQIYLNTDPMIDNPTMHYDSCENYPNDLAVAPCEHLFLRDITWISEVLFRLINIFMCTY